MSRLPRVLLSLALVGICQAQSPAPAGAKTAKAPTAAAMKPEVAADLSQLMRGILFPNSNVIFFAQEDDPAKVPPAKDPSLSPNPLASTYGGWLAVENSAKALSEAANLLILPGRKCANGLPVPINNPDWPKFVQGLREASLATYKAAQSKNMDNIVNAAGDLSTACSNCHDKWREKPELADRCK
ncbi:MAG TPA: hypothetical protein VK724_00625 [Bryobacteraceae bacterium]|nr:hypothetical protein [Bryobacteraceae bacterium]